MPANRSIIKFKNWFLLFCIVIFIIGFIIDRKPFCSKPDEYNEKVTIEYLKKFSQGNIKKIVILTGGNSLRFQAVCKFVIHDEKAIREFQSIISRQSPIIKKHSWGQTGRETHITLYNANNEKYSFILNGDPYSGKRAIHEIEISYFLNPEFDVLENWLPDPDNAISKNIRMYGPKSSNLQNYEVYFWLKKYILDSVEQNRKNPDGINGRCLIINNSN